MIQESFRKQGPTLYLVATPIGNLGDMSFRAVETLKKVKRIYAEDTRVSLKLLAHYGIDSALESYHEHNEAFKQERIIADLVQGDDVALISDAGTPLMSDPGYEVVQEAIRRGYPVVAIPGASALLAALVASGLTTSPFTFIGFLPRKANDAKRLVSSYRDRKETLIIYESPRRVRRTLELLEGCLGNRELVLARELTKIHETITRTTLKEGRTLPINEKGEYVLLLGKDLNENPLMSVSVVEHVEHYIRSGLDEKEAMKRVAKERKKTKSEVYRAYKIER
ncbi:MAG: 16S rRNA (cytidine(1402)-2'-O)-methyltransferase [Acholeplasmataceae bacterium]